MHTTNLRKVGGSVMMALPPTILDLLHLEVGSTVSLAIDGDRLVVDPKVKRRYTLDELLAQGDPNAPLSEEDPLWIDTPPVGREL